MTDGQKTNKKRKNVDNDVWDDYRYTKTETDQMLTLIKKYSADADQPTETTNDTNDCATRRVTRLSAKKTKIVVEKKPDDAMVQNVTKHNGWVSATKTKYFLLNDHAVDWLNEYYLKYGIHSDVPVESNDLTVTPTNRSKKRKPTTAQKSLLPIVSSPEKKDQLKDVGHMGILLDGGNTFEKKVCDELKNIYGDDFVVVFNEADMNCYRERRDMNQVRVRNRDVRTLMDRGVAMIAQAPMINEQNRTFGIADLLIRSDYLSVMINRFTPDDEIGVKAPMLKMVGGKSYHYRVIDFKWTTMSLCVDGVTIRNEGLFPAYKGQLAVYTGALESLQGYVPNYAYIMAKAWKIGKTNILPEEEQQYRGYSAFDRFGIIDYKTKDRKYLESTKNAIKWVQRVMTEGKTWRYGMDRPSVPEMYPNMCRSTNPAFDKVKEELAQRYGDPTMVWYVGVEHRQNAHAKNIFDVRDPRINLDVLGIKKTTKRGKIIEQIIETNKKNQTVDLVRPKVIGNNLEDWQNESPLDCYLDLESINYNLYTNPDSMDLDNSYTYQNPEVAFMIGMGFRYNQNQTYSSEQIIKSLNIEGSKCGYYVNIDQTAGWEFVCLHLVTFSEENEMMLFELFFQFILKREALIKEDNANKQLTTRLFHWTGAELRFFNKIVDRIKNKSYDDVQMIRLLDKFENSATWIDMCHVFEEEPITIKGSFRFKLKHIGNAFYQNGLIRTKWDDGMMSDGFRAMMEAIKLYRTKQKMTDRNGCYKEIIKYNEVDCRVIWEIVDYLRKNHCSAS